MIDRRSAALGHGGSFTVALAETLHMRDDTALYVNNATLTNTFLSTGAAIGNTNHYFYWIEKLASSNVVFNRAVLPERSYDVTELASELQAALNNASWLGDGLYTCVYNDSKQAIT